MTVSRPFTGTLPASDVRRRHLIGPRWRVWLLLALVAAGKAPQRPFPIPPIPPAARPAVQPAPVPDPDAAPPAQANNGGLRVVPRLLHVPTYQNEFDSSAGYMAGSRLQEDQSDHKLTPSPGVSLQIPLR